jgi:hypothetical protein
LSAFNRALYFLVHVMPDLRHPALDFRDICHRFGRWHVGVLVILVRGGGT